MLNIPLPAEEDVFESLTKLSTNQRVPRLARYLTVIQIWADPVTAEYL